MQYSKRSKRRDLILSLLVIVEVGVILAGTLVTVFGGNGVPLFTGALGIAMAAAAVSALALFASGVFGAVASTSPGKHSEDGVEDEI